jgi:hypothetical protein
MTLVGPVAIEYGIKFIADATMNLLDAVQRHQRTGKPAKGQLETKARTLADKIWKALVSRSMTSELYDKIGGRYTWNSTEVGMLMLMAMAGVGGGITSVAAGKKVEELYSKTHLIHTEPIKIDEK